jgi:hypothetical protein
MFQNTGCYDLISGRPLALIRWPGDPAETHPGANAQRRELDASLDKTLRIAPKAPDRVHTYLDLAAERDLAVVLTNFLDPSGIGVCSCHVSSRAIRRW